MTHIMKNELEVGMIYNCFQRDSEKTLGIAFIVLKSKRSLILYHIYKHYINTIVDFDYDMLGHFEVEEL